MLSFMDYIQNAFNSATNSNRDNSYGALTSTARGTVIPSSLVPVHLLTPLPPSALLDFPTPTGLRLHLSSLSTPHFATSYTLSTSTAYPIDGSLSYLYTSHALPTLESQSRSLPLRALTPSYVTLSSPQDPQPPFPSPSSNNPVPHNHPPPRTPTLLYGRLYLPTSTLEALYLRRLTPRTTLRLTSVSDARLKNGGSLLTLLSHDTGTHSTEYLYSTDSALLGVRGLYNFNPTPTPPSPSISTSTPHGLFSLGAELYYGLANASGGASTGLRFTTLPRHGSSSSSPNAFPYTMTLTLNPLMGNLSSTYSVTVPSRLLSLATSFDFNVYSYESRMRVGMELLRRSPSPHPSSQKPNSFNDGLDWARRKMAGFTSTPTSNTLKSKAQVQAAEQDHEPNGILKLRADADGGIGVLWEGRAKALLYSAGVLVDVSRKARGEGMFKGVGVEVVFSS
ncbi:Mitochondrial distribution and morphology protein 10 [Loxospora ochrophaea]|nr:Mitochondrial distribution and morphology protein 10 [Loxospora ochrophaea]